MNEQILINYTKEGDNFTLSIIHNGNTTFYGNGEQEAVEIVESLKNIIG